MRIIALFDLKPGTDPAAYEDWARSRDLPGVRSLVSVDDFHVYRATGVLFSENKPPYAYIEVLDVADMDGFMSDVRGDLVGALAKEMAEFTDNAVFITTEAVSATG